jgi:ketosteroid isomerase-like protein
MKFQLLILIFAFSCGSCKQHSEGNISHDESGKVLQADKNFNTFCQAHGRSAAFIAFAADSVIQMRDGAFPLIGKQALQSYYIQKNDTTSNLSWEPSRAEANGDIGYTFGWWKFKVRTQSGSDTLFRGTYVTVWKKQNNGEWKYILDAGNNVYSQTQ